MVRQADQVPSVRVRAATRMASCARETPDAQVTPTSPKPVTSCGVVTRRLAPPAAETTRAADVLRAARPGVTTGEVSCTSRTCGSTGAVGTLEVRTASAVYAA